MIELLKSLVEDARPDGLKKEDFRCRAEKAVLSADGEKLTARLSLNFVLPYEIIDRFKRSIIGQLPGVEAVDLTLDYEDLLQSPEEALPFYIPHMVVIVNGSYAHVTRTIYTDDFSLDDETLTIRALG
ncbi:MAG: hypothetical protein IJV66_00770, partial [Firmicutes bacterium]|nr:hypothetical protein [Bacillota bacterium]